MKTPAKLCLSWLCALSVVGCAANSDKYPSLSIRDFEREQGSFDAPPPAAAIEILPLPQDKVARVAALLEQLRASHARFLGEASSARRTISAAAGTQPGDDRWAAAQVALASLDSERSQSAVVLAELDQMVVDATLAVEQRDGVVAAREDTLARLREQDAVLEEMRGVVSR